MYITTNAQGKDNMSLSHSRGVNPVVRKAELSNLFNLDIWMARCGQCGELPSHWQQVEGSPQPPLKCSGELKLREISAPPTRGVIPGEDGSTLSPSTFCPKSSTILQGSAVQHFDSSLFRQCWTNSDEACSTCCTSTLTRAASYFIINPCISLNWSGCSPLSSAVSLLAAAHRTFAIIFA